MQNLAAYLLLKLAGNDAPASDDVKSLLTNSGVTVDEETLKLALEKLEGKNIDELIEAGKEKLSKFGGGGGGGAAAAGGAAGSAAAAEEEEEEKEEEKSVDMGGGNLFGDGDDDDY